MRPGLTNFLGSFAALVFIAMSGAAHANTISYDIDTTMGCCGSGPFGSVTATNTTGGIHVDATLNSGYLFINGGQGASFAFSLNVISSVMFQNVSTSWTPVSSTAGNLHMDGAGYYGFGLTAPGTNASQASASSLSFDILATV